MLTISSKYVLENQTGVPIEVKQRGAPDAALAGDSVVGGAGPTRRLGIGERAALHWEEADLPRMLVMRPFQADGSSTWAPPPPIWGVLLPPDASTGHGSSQCCRYPTRWYNGSVFIVPVFCRLANRPVWAEVSAAVHARHLCACVEISEAEWRLAPT